jgi:DNA-binding NtrC family response regulator
MRTAAGGTLILEDLERSSPAVQEQLLRTLERDEGTASAELGDARLVATTRVGLRRAAEEERLRDDLSHRLDRLQFRVPALRDRREDILPLAESIAGRLAREEHLLAPSFSDEALALLWRQPWAGNVRELESMIYKLVLLGRGRRGPGVEPLQPAQILEIAARFSLEIVERLPSRHPPRGDLLAALRATRKPGGRLNKTRAALYLGWDPDTLVARMQDAGIGETIEDEDAWATTSVSVEPDPETEPG